MKVYLVIEVETDCFGSKVLGLPFEDIRKIVMDESQLCNEEEFKAVDCYSTRPIELPHQIVLKEGYCPSCYGCGNVMVSHPNQCSFCGGSGKLTKGGSNELGFNNNSTTTSI
jgi:hypothetical protein